MQSDRECTIIYNDCLPILKKLMDDKRVRNTSSVMYMFVQKTSQIKKAIYILTVEKNLYSINILFRSLIEHFLRFQYITLRHQFDNSDVIGKEYVEHLSESEKRQASKAWKEIARITNSKDTDYPFEVLRKVNESMKDVSESEINNTERDFQYKQLIRYIFEKTQKDKSYKPEQFLLNLLVEYSKLSSYVHGGPVSDALISQINEKEQVEKECLRIAELSFRMATTTKLISLKMYGAYHPELRIASNKLASILF